MPNSSTIKKFIGKKYIVEYDSDFNNKIGKGGNGTVYPVINLYDKSTKLIVNSNEQYVIKVFHANKRFNGKERFKREIKFVVNNSKYLKNIVHIEDYDEDHKWYLMLRHKEFSSGKKAALEDKLNKMIQIGIAIKSIHDLDGINAHRDIKPKNILIDNSGNALLSDFGCIFRNDSDRITGKNEYIGPSNIRPPELEAGFDNKNVDYRKSDVYLFAKTCWIIFTNNYNGFDFEYDAQNKNIAINNNFGCKTIQPIHEMITKATKTNWKDRIDTDDCLKYLEVQLMICKSVSSSKDINKMVVKDVINNAIITSQILKESFGNDIKVCDSFLGKLPTGTRIIIKSLTTPDINEIAFASYFFDGKNHIIKSEPSLSLLQTIIFRVKDIVLNKDQRCLEVILADCESPLKGHIDYFSKEKVLNSEQRLIIENNYNVKDSFDSLLKN